MSSTSETGLVVASRRGSPQRLEVCNIPTDPSLELSQDVSLLLENIRLTIAWASKIADSLLEEKLASGELQAEDLDNIENYRREAVNAAFDRHATWLTPSVRTTISSPLDIRNGDLTPSPRLTSIGIPPNSGAFDLLRNTIEDIKRASLGSEATVYHYNHIVSINFDPRTEGLDATLQTLRLSLKVTKSASKNYSSMWTPAWMSGIVLKVDRGHWACPAKFLDWLASMIPGEGEEIHVDSEISRVQYQFSNNMFMDLKDTVIRTVQGVGVDGRACG